MLTRRQFTATAASASAALLLPCRAGAQAQPLPLGFGGVRMGVCLYNFRSLPRLDDPHAYLGSMIDACRAVGLGLVEINATYIEPRTRLPFAGIPRLWDAPLSGAQAEAFARLTPEEVAAERATLRRWRIETPPDHFAAIAERFRAAGLTPFSYVMTFTPDMDEEEIAAIFRHAAALGVGVFSTNQTKVEMAPRLAPFAERFAIALGFHNHAAIHNPNEVASRNSLERLLSVSPRIMINLDTGHYIAGNQDIMGLIEERFERITHFHIKDRRRDEGPNVPLGEGDTPIGEVLRAIRRRGAATPAIIEYEYPGTGTPVEETRRCIDYMRRQLEA